MKIIDTNISWGYQPLIEIFAKANNLVLKLEPYYSELRKTESVAPGKETEILIGREYIRISYAEDSDTALSITFMSVRHLGLENMLCDYLIRCGIAPGMIPYGKFIMKKSDEQMEKDWQEHRKKIGLV